MASFDAPTMPVPHGMCLLCLIGNLALIIQGGADGCHQGVFNQKKITDLMKANGWAKTSLLGSTDGAIKILYVVNTATDSGGC